MSKLSIYLDPNDVWNAIETGTSIDTVYPDKFNTEYLSNEYYNWMDKQMSKSPYIDEQYVLLKGIWFDYAVTSYARVFNCDYKKSVGIHTSKNDLHTLLRGKKLNISKVFKQNGWVFNYTYLIQVHQSNGWTIKDKISRY